MESAEADAGFDLGRIAFLRTRIDNPLLCLTVSMTLREKPTRGIIAGFELPVEEPETLASTRPKGAFVTSRDLEDVNLLDDFGSSPFTGRVSLCPVASVYR